MAKRYVKNNELNDYIKELISQGCTISYGKHLKIRLPNNRLVSCSITPSCPFVAKKVKADVQRALAK